MFYWWACLVCEKIIYLHHADTKEWGNGGEITKLKFPWKLFILKVHCIFNFYLAAPLRFRWQNHLPLFLFTFTFWNALAWNLQDESHLSMNILYALSSVTRELKLKGNKDWSLEWMKKKKYVKDCPKCSRVDFSQWQVPPFSLLPLLEKIFFLINKLSLLEFMNKSQQNWLENFNVQTM